MALELMDEHEKGERVRAWLRQNGSAIVTGVALGLALIFGWQWWQRSRVEHRITAATQYQALRDAVERKEADLVAALATELGDQYADTPYAALGSLQLADVRLAAGDHAAAAEALQRAAAQTEDAALDALIGLRRARVLLAGGDAQAALDAVEGAPRQTYPGLAQELRGDALQALGKHEEAREAYREALTALDTGAANRRIVEMKLADLGGEPEPSEA